MERKTSHRPDISETTEDADPALVKLLSTYHELNAGVVDELDEIPDALEFMRYVAINRPFVVRNAASAYTAVRKWNAEYLRDVMGEQPVQVAITPYGNADAIVYDDETGEPIFVEPFETEEPFSQVLASIQQDTALWQADPTQQRNVKYAQTQNSNLTSEYHPLAPDMPASMPFASAALGQPQPDAVNFWLGNARSTTSLHKDNYENIYIQVRGSKIFTLLSPCEMPCVNEQPVRRGRYIPTEDPPADGTTADLKLEITLPDLDPDEGDDTGDELVPAPLWDLTSPATQAATATPYSHLARPLRVTLNEGDMMYLPALWYHRVEQRNGSEGFSCSVNYWYDLDFRGGFWALNQGLVRDVYAAAQSREGKGETKKTGSGAIRLADY